MSKGDNMLSTEGQFMSKEAKTAKSSASKVSKNVKRLLSLQEAINDIDKQASALIKKDQEKRRIFIKDFSKSKRKVEKRIGDFVKLMKDLKLRKNKEKNKQTEERLDKLIKRVEGNIRKYQSKLRLSFYFFLCVLNIILDVYWLGILMKS